MNTKDGSDKLHLDNSLSHKSLHEQGIPHIHGEINDLNLDDEALKEIKNIACHSHGGAHGHIHSHQYTKAVLARLSRASGHLNSVRKMIEEGKDCSEVLIQLSAVISALHNAGKVILKDHLQNCILDAIQTGDQKAIDDFNQAIDRFVK